MRKSKHKIIMASNKSTKISTKPLSSEKAIINSENNILKSSSDEEWIQIVYEEAWRQYIHEDQMAEQRDTKYLTILSLILTGVGFLLSKILFDVSGIKYYELKGCITLIAMLVPILFMLFIVFLLSKHWDNVTDAGCFYSRMRFEVAKRIEDSMQMSITLAQSEEEQLKKYNAENSCLHEGFSSTHGIIRIIKVFSVLGLVFVILAMVALLVNVLVIRFF